MIKRGVFLLFLLQVIFAFSQQDSTASKDIKVGLVLSGGGAKGFAHVGVLKVLEEAGVRIDHIGGTSMGAIVGSLYASGYSAKELDSIILSFNYDELMQDELPRRSKSIYQKENTEKYALTLPFKNKVLTLPLAVSKGQNVSNLLSKLTEHVHGVSDFSELPIPFFCMATNLETGKSEVLDKGYLPEAVRASGSFPTLLDPVEIDSKLLTDGGVMNNFPVDIMKQKGVDIVIGVDVQDRLDDKNQLNTAPKIIMQIVNFQMYDDLEQKRRDTDLYIHPDISEFTVVSFDLARQIIDKGEEAAKSQLSLLKKIAEQQSLNPKKEIKRNAIAEELHIKKVNITGLKHYTDEYVLSKLNLKDLKPLTYKKFNEGINNLSATGNFRNIQYKFIHHPDNELELSMNIREQEISSFLQFGIHYDDLYKTAALVNFTSKHAIFDNDVFSADIILGDNIRFNLDYFIDNGFHWSYGIKARYNSFKKPFFAGSVDPNVDASLGVSKIPLDYNDFTVQAFIQTAFNRDLALKLGTEGKHINIYYEKIIDDDSFNEYIDNTHYLNLFASLILDTQDDKDFPKKGLYLFADYKTYLVATSNKESVLSVDDFDPFSQLKGKISTAISFNRFTTEFVSEAGITIGTSPRVFDYFLGGNNRNFINNFSSFYGYDVADLSERAYLKSALTFRYEPFKNQFASVTANVARLTDDIFNEGRIFEDSKLGYGIGYGFKSPIGPIEVKYTWSPDTSKNFWFFNVGFWF